MKTTGYKCALAMLTTLAGLLAAAAGHAQGSWTDTVKVDGDIRLRYEGIDEAGEEERNRGRFRVRLNVKADVNDAVKAVIQFATGGDNPVSANQTFDDGFSGKDITLHQAYLDWTLNDQIHVYGGKMKNPFLRPGGHSLIWDSDVNPEGLALRYENGGFFGTAALMFVEERSSADDSLLTAVQGGFNFVLADGVDAVVGATVYDYSNTVANSPFFNGNGNGNTVDIGGDLVYGYTQIEVFAELGTKLGEMPLRFFADLVRNTDAGSNDTGYAFGVAVAEAAEPGSWEASTTYQQLESDAVIATFTDSDFGGGGTDNSGFVFKGKYALRDNWALAGSFFLNEIESDIGNRHDYNRVQIDLEFKF